MTPLSPEAEAALALLELGRGHGYPGHESDASSLLQSHPNAPRHSTFTVEGAASASCPAIVAVLNGMDDSSLLFRYDPSGIATKDDNEARHLPKAGRIGVLSHRAALDVTLDPEHKAAMTLMCMRTQLPSLTEAQRLLATHQRSSFARSATVQAKRTSPEPFKVTAKSYLDDEDEQPLPRVAFAVDGRHTERHHSPSLNTTLPLSALASQSHAPTFTLAAPPASITSHRYLASSQWFPGLSPIPESTCTSPHQPSASPPSPPFSPHIPTFCRTSPLDSPLSARLQHIPLFLSSIPPISLDSSPESPHPSIRSSSPLSPAPSEPPSPSMLPAEMTAPAETHLAAPPDSHKALVTPKKSLSAEACLARLRHLYPSPSPSPKPTQTRIRPLVASEAPDNVVDLRSISPSPQLRTSPQPSVKHTGAKPSSKLASRSTRKGKRRTPRLGMPPRRRRTWSQPTLPDDKPRSTPETVGVESPVPRIPNTPPLPLRSTGPKALQRRWSFRVASRNGGGYIPDLSDVDVEERPRVLALLARARVFDWTIPDASIGTFCRTFEVGAQFESYSMLIQNGAGVEYLLRNKYRSVMKCEPQLRDRL